MGQSCSQQSKTSFSLLYVRDIKSCRIPLMLPIFEPNAVSKTELGSSRLGNLLDDYFQNNLKFTIFLTSVSQARLK
jgi:hypothetical protein